MNERTTYENSYPFSWLDEVIEITLNPDKSNLKQIKNETLAEIQARLPEEIAMITRSVKGQAFSLYSNEQVKVVAGHYDQAIRILQREARYNQRFYPQKGTLFKTGQMILGTLEDIHRNIQIRYGIYLPETRSSDQRDTEKTERVIEKILCALSADQIGIILRSAYDVKMIIGKSFRRVCQAIAPYLSTLWKIDVSWDTIRSSSGRPEIRDKEIAIQMLEKMIEKIRGYR